MTTEATNTLETVAIDLIQKTISNLEGAKDFVVSELPDVVSQLLVWNGVESFIWFIVGVIILILMIYGNIRQIRYWKEQDEVDPRVLLNIIQMFTFIASIECLNITWLKIWLAPKVWLIEYVSELTR